MPLKYCHTIRWLFEQGHPNLKDNPNSVLEYLRNGNADIICLQEYILSNRLAKKDVDYALRNYPYKHYYKLTGANGLGCYPAILSCRRILLSMTAETMALLLIQ